MNDTRIFKSTKKVADIESIPSDILPKVMSLLEETIGIEVKMHEGEPVIDLNIAEELGIEMDDGDGSFKIPVTIDQNEPLHRGYTGLKTKPLYIMTGDTNTCKMVQLKLRKATDEEITEFRNSDRDAPNQFDAISVTFDMPYLIPSGTEIEYYDENFNDHVHTVYNPTKVPLHYVVYVHYRIDDELEELVNYDVTIHTHSVMGYLI